MGAMDEPVCLYDIPQGDTVTVEKVGGKRIAERLRAMGIVEGKRLRVISKMALGGPQVIMVGNTRITIGQGMAKKILVRP